MAFTVYKHTSPSGKSYVGFTSHREAKRWSAHVATAMAGSRNVFHRAIRKYGPEAFTHEVLDCLTTLEGAKRAEQLWICELGTLRLGYNRRPGGDGGVVPGPATRGRMSTAQVARHVQNPQLREALRARSVQPKSPETRAKMAESARRVSAARTPEERSRIAALGGASLRGKPKSAETRARMKAAQQKRAAAKKVG